MGHGLLIDGKKKTVLDKEKAFELYQMGHCDKEIGEQLGVRKETVATWRNKLGLRANPEPRKKTTRPKSRLSICAEEAELRGMTYGQYMANRK